MTPEDRKRYAEGFARDVKKLLVAHGQQVEPSVGYASRWLEREIMKACGVHIRHDALRHLLNANREPTLGEACAIFKAFGYEITYMKEGK